MDGRVIGTLLIALALFVGGPVAGWIFVMSNLAEASKADALLQLSAVGLLGAAAAWSAGIGLLVQLVLYVHCGKSSVVATDGSVAIAGHNTAEITIRSTAGPQKTAISRLQWGDIEAWAITDDDVNALAERYRDATKYELVDALPNTTLSDGRYVHDISVEFMYPHGAQAVIEARKQQLSEA